MILLLIFIMLVGLVLFSLFAAGFLFGLKREGWGRSLWCFGAAMVLIGFIGLLWMRL